MLYEGYVLWPYRRSAVKNQRRWTFGAVLPPDFCERTRAGDTSVVRCETIVEGGPRARIGIELRFLHLVHRQALAATGDGGPLLAVDRLRANGRAWLTWDEAAERRVALPERTLGALLHGPLVERVRVAGGSELETIRDARGARAGALRRAWEPIEATVRIAADRLSDGVFRLRTVVANRSAWRGADRAEAQRRSPLSTHLVQRARDGAFCSLADPPPALASAAASCINDGLWPVLVGEPGARDALLASPIILDDHPRVAPESPGDLFDGGEIDQLLVLSILALTDEEKAEMAATDPRVHEILRRTERLSPADMLRLHGTFRDPRTRRTR